MSDAALNPAGVATTPEPSCESKPDVQQQADGSSPVKARGSKAAKLVGALACVIVTVIAWIAMAQILQLLNLGDASYPWFETWVVHDCYIFFALPIGWTWLSERVRRQRAGDNLEAQNPSTASSSSAASQGSQKFTIKRWLVVGFWLSLLYFGVEYTWYLSLPRTSVSANTAIYNSSPAFVFIFAVLMLHDKVNASKILALLVSLPGVAIVAVYTSTEDDAGSGSSGDDGQSTGDAVFGYSMLILSTVTYALYQVLFLKYAVDPADPLSFKNTFWFTASMGLSNILFFWIGIPILNATGDEALDPKPSGETIGILLGVGALAAIFQVFTQLAIMLSSPIFVAVTQLLTIPLSIATDAVISGYVMPGKGFIGIAMIVIGFFLINASEIHGVLSGQRKGPPTAVELFFLVGKPLFPEKAKSDDAKARKSPPASEGEVEMEGPVIVEDNKCA